MFDWFLTAYKEGATTDIVAKTRDIKKRHQQPQILLVDHQKKVYNRRRLTQKTDDRLSTISEGEDRLSSIPEVADRLSTVSDEKGSLSTTS